MILHRAQSIHKIELSNYCRESYLSVIRKPSTLNYKLFYYMQSDLKPNRFLIITTLKHAYEYWALVCHNIMAHKFPSRFRLPTTLLCGIITPPSFRVTMGQQKFLSCEVFFDDQAIRMGMGSYGLLHINRLQYMTSDFFHLKLLQAYLDFYEMINCPQYWESMSRNSI